MLSSIFSRDAKTDIWRDYAVGQIDPFQVSLPRKGFGDGLLWDTEFDKYSANLGSRDIGLPFQGIGEGLGRNVAEGEKRLAKWHHRDNSMGVPMIDSGNVNSVFICLWGRMSPQLAPMRHEV